MLVVVPSGVARGYRYSLAAIAWALALRAYERTPAPPVRARTSTSKTVGASSVTRWASLCRCTRCALALFGIATPEVGTVRERAARMASFVAAYAPIARGPVQRKLLVAHDYVRRAKNWSLTPQRGHRTAVTLVDVLRPE